MKKKVTKQAKSYKRNSNYFDLLYKPFRLYKVKKYEKATASVSSILKAQGLQTSYIPLSLLFFLFFSKRFDFFCWLGKVGMPWSCSMKLKKKKTLISVALLLHMNMHYYTLLRLHIYKAIWTTLESLFSFVGKNASSLE